MRVEIRDKQLLGSLEPTSLVGYLKSRQWNIIAKAKSDVPIFSKGDLQVVLPLSRRYADYGLRIGELLQALELDESRSQLEIFEDLVFSSADRIRFRLQGPIAKRGALPINLGVAFFEKSRDVIQAAACAAVDTKPYYHGRRVQKVEDYMRRVYLGQTERGSFVVNAGSPVPRPVERLVDDEEIPFERLVTEMLLKGVSAAKSAAEAVTLGTSDDPFLESHHQGVSANLCDALSGLFLGEENTQLEIGLQWSPLRRAPKLGFSSILLESSIAPILEQASRSLKRRAPREDFRLDGTIVSLHRDEGAQQGKVVVYGLVDDDYRRITIELEDETYGLAVEAHGQRHPVTLEGELRRRGKSYILKNPRGMRIIDLPEESEESQLDL